MKNSMRETVSNGSMKTRKGERVFLAVGLTLLAIWAGARLHGSIASRAAMQRFHANTAAGLGAGNRVSAWDGSTPNTPVDFTLWNPKRVAAYKDSLAAKTDLPIAILRIPRINLEVPVFDDTDDLTLNRGVGRIIGTAQMGQPGNLGIAGHRDGFFRGLKDVGREDIIELMRPGRTDRYLVSEMRIVNPEDVSVLAPTPTPTLTLVTCFPFYYVGNAPQRYVVIASPQVSNRSDQNVNRNSISTWKKNNKGETR